MSRSLPTVIVLLLLTLPALAGGVFASAADQHTAPRVTSIVRTKAGRVRSCQVSCTLVGNLSPRARFTLHRAGDYDRDRASMDDAAKRGVAAGIQRAPITGRAARWVSSDVTKTGHATPIDLALDFGDDGLAGSEDPTARWLLTSVHFARAPKVGGPAPHVFAAETAPVQRPEAAFYVTFD